jgi:hypothetical protein
LLSLPTELSFCLLPRFLEGLLDHLHDVELVHHDHRLAAEHLPDGISVRRPHVHRNEFWATTLISEALQRRVYGVRFPILEQVDNLSIPNVRQDALGLLATVVIRRRRPPFTNSLAPLDAK